LNAFMSDDDIGIDSTSSRSGRLGKLLPIFRPPYTAPTYSNPRCIDKQSVVRSIVWCQEVQLPDLATLHQWSAIVPHDWPVPPNTPGLEVEKAMTNTKHVKDNTAYVFSKGMH